MKRRLGFTLVEMVIVIAVIGILATVLVPTFGGIIDRANESTDVQTAGNLTTLIAMYGVEHKIETETDIALAINAGKGDPEFYQNLKAKSAKQGNCFWYEYSTGTVVVGTVEKIIERSKEQAEPATMGPAGDATVDGGIRSYIVPGYLLLGHNADNKLLDAVCDLESPGIAKYTDGFAKLYQLVADNADKATVKTALDAFVAKVKQTVLLTSDGLFLPAGVTTVDKVYIPLGTVTLSNTTVHIVSVDENGNVSANPGDNNSFELVDSFKLQLPLGTQIGANVLDLQRNDTENNPFMTGSDEIHVNAEESALGSYFFADTTDAVIVLPNGDRYILNDTNFVKLTATNEVPVEGVAAPALGELNSFGIGVEDGVDPNYALSKNFIEQDKTFDLFVSADHLGGSITLSANNFEGTLNGQAAILPIRRITVGVFNADGDEDRKIAHSTKGLTSVITNFEDGDTITVKARDITYTYNVKVVEINAFALGGISNSEMGLHDDFAMTYNSGNDVWTIVPSIGYTYKDTGVDLNVDLSVDSSKFNTTSDGKTLTLKSAITGEQTDTLTITCRDKKVEGVAITLYDASLDAFKPNPNLDAMNAATDAVFVIGGQGKLTLGDLFALKAEGTSVNRVTMEVLNASGPISLKDAENWATYELQTIFSNNIDADTELTIKLSSHGSETGAQVTVKFVESAHNVYDAASWKAVPASTNIAVLRPIDIDGANQKDTCASYEKNVGAATVYGNLQKITVTNFVHKTDAQANTLAFITINNGAVEYAIIDGPDYQGTVSILGDDSTSKGTYVHGIHAKGDKGEAAIGARISNSFISGFRAPVQAQSGKITITNTVLNKGNYANISVDGSTDLILNGVTTIQYETSGGSGWSKWSNIGAGIAYKYNSGTSTITEQGAGLTQYNYYTKTQIENIVNSAANVLPIVSITIDLPDEAFETAKSKMGHTISGTQYYNVGIIEINLNINKTVLGKTFKAVGTPAVTPTLSGYNNIGPYESNIKVYSIYSVGTAGAKFHGEANCTGTCSHVLPSTDVNTHIADFLSKVK